MTATTTNPFLRAFEALPPAEAPWLNELRSRAFARFEQLGFPTQRDEDWKYLNPAPLGREGLHAAGAAKLPTAAQIDALALAPFTPTRLVFVDGRYAPQLSACAPLPEGAYAGGLAAALAAGHDERIRRVLNDRIGDERHAFAAINTAFALDGAYVYVPKNARVSDPVHLLFVTAAEGGAMAHPRVVVVAEPGAAVTVVEHHVSLGDGPALTNAATEIDVDQNAEVRYVQLQRQGAAAQFVATLDAAVARDGRFLASAVSVGAALARNDFDVALMGEGAHCTLDGLMLSLGAQQVDYHTSIVHARPHGTSRELFKAVAAGSSTAVFNGRVVVPPDSQKTDSEQASHNLLLSREAAVNAKPQLEIYADDVKCAHGTTVGQLDAQAVFYLRARGLSETEARSMLTHAFAADVIERLPVEALRDAINELTAAWFPAAEKQ